MGKLSSEIKALYLLCSANTVRPRVSRAICTVDGSCREESGQSKISGESEIDIEQKQPFLLL